MIGHLKNDCGMARSWMKGELGDALHAVLCAAGYNLRWLMRAVARMGLRALTLLVNWLASVLAQPGIARTGALTATAAIRN